MPRITYIDPSGATHALDVPTGLSVMRGAVDNGLPGMRAECGGACACATCPVLVGPDWTGKIPPPGETETSMLDGDTIERGMTRRLSCQIEVTAALDGLVVQIPAT